ncbi:MAG: Crp/Fnr family transcriptional regulator [Synechococcus sp.]
MVASPSRSSGEFGQYRQKLEDSFNNRGSIHLSAGSSVPLLRKSVWIVVRGMIKLGSVSIHGDEIMLGLAGPNELFGESLSNVEAYEAIAVTDCDLLCISLAEVKECPELAFTLFQSISMRYRQAESMLAILALKTTEEKMKAFLELLALDYGQTCDDGLRVNMRLTHQELASALCTTRVTVTRILGQLRQDGWLKLDKSRHWVVASPQAE